MPPYRYDMPQTEPLAGSIADLIQRGGDIRALSAMQTAQINAQASAARGANWGNTISNLSQLPLQLSEQARRDKLADLDVAYKTQAMKNSQAQLDEQERQRKLETDATGALVKAIQGNRDPETGKVNAQGVVEAIEPQYPGVGYAWAQHYAAGEESFNKLAAANREQRKQETLYLAQAAQNNATPGDFLAAISTARVNGELSPKRAAEIQQQLETGDYTTIRPQLVKAGDDIAPLVKASEGDTFFKGVSGAPKFGIPKPLRPTYTPEQVQYAKAQGHDEPTLGDITAVAALDAQRKRSDAVSQATAIHEANANADEVRKKAAVADPKFQSGLEKTYIASIKSAMARANPVGQEDLKVRGSNDLITVMNQFYNPQTGNYDIPEQQLNELALGLAKIIAPGGQAGVQMMNEFRARTAKGDTAKLWTYVTGKPQVASTPEQAQLLRESIERIGKTSEQQREAQLDFLRQLSPADLEPARRDRLAHAELVPLYRTRVLQNPQTGERRLQTSTDGGKTWQ